MQDAVKSYASLFIETFTSLFIKTAVSIEDITNMLDETLGQKKRFFKFIQFSFGAETHFCGLEFTTFYLDFLQNVQKYWTELLVFRTRDLPI